MRFARLVRLSNLARLTRLGRISRLALACAGMVPMIACSSASSAPATGGGGGDAGGSIDSAVSPGSVVEHGAIVDYFSLKPVAGLTVTDNGVTTTTDAKGAWSLTVPAASTLQPIVTGPAYTKLLFPDSTASGADVDFGTAVMPDSSTYNLEQNALTAFDPAKALVQVVLIATGNCKSVVGGTAKVVSPAGATLTYFSSTAVPSEGETAFQDVKPNRPVVVIADIDVGADLVVKIDHPTCKQVPFPSTYAGKTYSGKVRTLGAEPGDINAALVILME